MVFRHRWLLAAALLPALALPAAASTPAPPTFGSAPDTIHVHCRVFQDADSSGTFDAGESLLAGIGISNGYNTFVTDAQGEVDVPVDRAIYRFATLSIPAGQWPTTSWFHWVPVGTAGPDTVDFGLKVCPETAADVDSIRWIHIADTQVQTWTEPYRMDLDFEQINRLPEHPLFLINTGDLVEVGTDSTHWNHYVSQLAVSHSIVFPVVGNHDVIPALNECENYERWAGPPYYSFDAGNWHFVVYNGAGNNANAATPMQDIWLHADLFNKPPGSHAILFQHYLAQESPAPKVAYWASAGVVANFSGHWHSHQFAERSYGVADYNISWTRNGSVDRTPRVFGMVTCTRDGQIRYEQRRLRVDHRSSVASPQAQQTVGRDAVEILVNAYDSASLVSHLTASISGAGGGLPGASLTREGISLWRVLVDASSLPPGPYTVTISGGFADGAPISLSQSFYLDDIVPITRAPSTDWPMFRRCSAGSSYVDLDLHPPLRLAWCIPVTGMVAESSPVVAGGKVYFGCRPERSVGEAGVTACDAVTGSVDWFAHLPSGIALAPAVAGNVVLATTMSDSIYGLDRATGARLWAVRQIEPKYTMTAPIFEGSKVWAGTEPKPQQLQWATGARDWITENLGSPWYSTIIYSAPAVGPNYIYFSFFGWDDPTTGGFKIVSRTDGSTIRSEAGCNRSPIWTPDYVYVVGALDRNNQTLTARNETGAAQWVSATNMGAGTGSPAIAHGILVVPGQYGAIQGFRASDGLNLWTKPVDTQLYDMEEGWGDVHASNSTPAIADSIVYVGSNDGRLYALDLFTGAELWRWDLGVPIASSPAISGNMLFVAAEDEHLYAFVMPTGGGGGPTGTPLGASRGPAFEFLAPRPNPSAGATTFAWIMPERARASIRIYDVAGRLVRSLVDQTMEAGPHQMAWDGTDGRGLHAASGVYFAKLRAGSHSAVRKLVHLHR
ncbi:MAG: PQQ-binding-like beta-propeller repeat protein [bacterium]